MAVGAVTKWSWLVLAASILTVLVSVHAKKYRSSPKIPVIVGPPPPRPPPPPPPIHVEAAYAPPIPPCYPVTEYVTSVQYVKQERPIYKTAVERVSLPTYIYDTSYITYGSNVVRTVYTTVHRQQRAYDTSMVRRTVYSTTLNVVAVPAVETVTNIRLLVDPSTTTAIRTVTRASDSVVNVNRVVTRTTILRPEFTITQPINYPVDSTLNSYVTVTVPRYSTVTVTAAAVKKGPRVTQTVTQTEQHFTPAFVTETVFMTRGVTVTDRQAVPYTVTVSAPCGVGSAAVLGGAAIGGGGGGVGFGGGFDLGGGGSAGLGGGFGLSGGGGGGGGGSLGGGFGLGGATGGSGGVGGFGSGLVLRTEGGGSSSEDSKEDDDDNLDD